MPCFQLLRLNVKGQLAVGERCLELVGQKIKVAVCSVSPTGYWSYDKVSCNLSRDSMCRQSFHVLPF